MKPTKFNVFGKTIKIKYADLKSIDLLGQYIPDKNLIIIDQTLEGYELKQSLIHECLHSLFDRLGFEQLDISLDAEEMFCENVATWIAENMDFKGQGS